MLHIQVIRPTHGITPYTGIRSCFPHPNRCYPAVFPQPAGFIYNTWEGSGPFPTVQLFLIPPIISLYTGYNRAIIYAAGRYQKTEAFPYRCAHVFSHGFPARNPRVAIPLCEDIYDINAGSRRNAIFRR